VINVTNVTKTKMTCVAARRRLQAFHDRELSVRDEIAVAAHVHVCEACASTLAELRAVGSALSTLTAMGHGRLALSNEEAAAFNATVVSRLKAEDDASLFSRVREMFDDMHLVYAGLGATFATVVCVVIMLGMMRFATNKSIASLVSMEGERPDSLAAIVNVLATPLECESGNGLTDTSGCRARWEARFQRANQLAEQESVFALDAVVTHQSGRLANLEAMRAGHRALAGQAKAIEVLLDAVSRAHFEGAPTVHVPVSASMLWLVEHATVRANKQQAPLEQLPPKKRAETSAHAVLAAA
jgi:hypothetical protein